MFVMNLRDTKPTYFARGVLQRGSSATYRTYYEKRLMRRKGNQTFTYGVVPRRRAGRERVRALAATVLGNIGGIEHLRQKGGERQ